MTDSPGSRAILVFVAAIFMVILVYLISLSSRPSIADLAPAPNSETPPGPVSIGATLSSSARPIQRVILQVDGQRVDPAVEVRSERVWVVNYTSVFPSGAHDIAVQVVDVDGQTARHTWSFTAAGPRVTPTLTFVGPAAGDVLAAGLVRIDVQAVADSKITSATMSINGEPQSVSISPASSSNANAPSGGRGPGTWSVIAEPALAPGDYTVRVTVEDEQGDTSKAETKFTVTEDPGQATARYFSETGIYVRGEFKQFWEAHNGMTMFGNPVSEEFVDSRGVTVQYFENSRFERNQDGSVSLGLLGREALGQSAERVENPNNPAVRYFDATGHTLAGKFREFWEQNGGLAIFGYPITEETDEGGVRVQYFERARLELQPGSNGSEMTVRVTPLGRDLWQAANSASR